MKQCNKCRESKSDGEFYKYRKMCKKCHHKRCSPYINAYQKRNKKNRQEYQKEYYAEKRKDPEWKIKMAKRSRDYHAKNREAITARRRELRQQRKKDEQA